MALFLFLLAKVALAYLSTALSVALRPLFPFQQAQYAFSRTGGILFDQNSSTHRFSRFPPINLCSLVMLAGLSLVFAATNTPTVKLLSL